MVVKYELDPLERLMAKELTALTVAGQPEREDAAVEFKLTVDLEVERIKTQLSTTSVELGQDADMQQYMRRHQLQLMRLSGRLLAYAAPDEIVYAQDANDPGLPRYVYLALQDLLLFIERQFPAYYDDNAWIPADYRRMVVRELGKDLQVLKTSLSTRGCDAQLLYVVMNPFEVFMQNSTQTRTRVTSGKLSYLKRLKHELHKFCMKCGNNTDINTQLQDRLLTVNLNSQLFYDYCTGQIKKSLDVTHTRADKLTLLSGRLKQVRQAYQKAGTAYKPEAPSAKQQVAEWLEQEIRFWEFHENLEKSLPAPGLLKPHDTQTNRHPLPSAADRALVEMSMSQLAVWFRLKRDNHVFGADRSIQSMLQFVVEHYRTKETPAPSFKSIYNRYYDVEESTKQAILSLLHRFMQSLKSY